MQHKHTKNINHIKDKDGNLRVPPKSWGARMLPRHQTSPLPSLGKQRQQSGGLRLQRCGRSRWRSYSMGRDSELPGRTRQFLLIAAQDTKLRNRNKKHKKIPMLNKDIPVIIFAKRRNATRSTKNDAPSRRWRRHRAQGTCLQKRSLHVGRRVGGSIILQLWILGRRAR